MGAGNEKKLAIIITVSSHRMANIFNKEDKLVNGIWKYKKSSKRGGKTMKDAIIRKKVAMITTVSSHRMKNI